MTWDVVLVLVLVVEVGASRERAVVKVGKSSGLSGAVERSMAVFRSDSPAAGVVGERRGEEEVDSSTLSVSSTLMMVAWCGVGGAGGAGGWKESKLLLFLKLSSKPFHEYETLTGGNGKRDFLSSKGAEDTAVDIAILDAGTCTKGVLGAMTAMYT